MKHAISKHLFLLLAIILAGTGQVFADTSPVLKGDVNNSGDITVTDAMLIIDYMYDNPPDIFNLQAADLNNDENYTVTDFMIIIDIIYNGAVDAGGTISGWTEGNENPETPLTLEGDEDEDESYGD